MPPQGVRPRGSRYRNARSGRATGRTGADREKWLINHRHALNRHRSHNTPKELGAPQSATNWAANALPYNANARNKSGDPVDSEIWLAACFPRLPYGTLAHTPQQVFYPNQSK